MAFNNRNLYKIQEVLSGGEIGGLLTPANPLHSVHLNDTPMAKANGDINFKGADIIMRNGAAIQEPVAGFEDLAQTIAVGSELEPFTWVVQEIPAGFDRARLVIRSPSGINRYSSKGKYQAWNFNIDIEVSTDQTGWVRVETMRQEHRTSQSFDWVYTVSNPEGNEGNNYYVRVQRASNLGNERETWNPNFHAFVALGQSNPPQTYPHSAYASLQFDSAIFGTQLPRRGYRFKGIKCLVPEHYNPTEYDPNTGEVTAWASYDDVPWSGVLLEKHCDDPAWIAYNLMVNEVWGAGKTVDKDAIDIFSFYEASRYNVDTIDDGINPPHPRFVWNGRIASISNMRSMVNDILATCMSAIYEEENGLITLYQDRPTQPSVLFIRGNVVDGQMTFTSAPLDSRVTACEVTFNDRTNRFEPSTLLAESGDSLLASFGYRQTNISLNGVVDRPQALRAGRWVIENTGLSAQAATLTVGWENWDVGIGAVAYVVDEAIYSEAVQSRIDSINGTTVTQRNPNPRSFANEKIYIQTRLGLMETFATGTDGEYTFEIADATNVESFNAFVITNDTLPQYRVNGFQYNEGEKSLTLGFYDPTKYSRIETGEAYDPIYPPVDDEAPNAPRNLAFTGVIVDNQPIVTPSWRAPASKDDPTLDDTDVAYYLIEARTPDGSRTEQTPEEEFDLTNASFGTYTVSVRAVNNRGVTSAPIEGEFVFELENVSSLLPPTQIAGSFLGKDVNISWYDNPANATAPQLSVAAFVVEFGTSTVSTSRTVRIPVVDDHNPQVEYRSQYNFDDNTQDNDPAVRTVHVRVRVEDNMGQLSTPTSTSFTNSAPMAPRQTLVGGLTDFMVSLLPDASLTDWESDVAGFVVEVDGVQTDMGLQTIASIPAAPETTYQVRSAAYDVFGKTGLDWSPLDTVTTIKFPDPPVIPDVTRREFTFAGLNITVLDSAGSATGSLSWGQHTAFREIVNETDGTTSKQQKTVPAGSISWAGARVIYYDWVDNTIKAGTFDSWVGIEHHNHGYWAAAADFRPSAAQGVVTADKLIANAISTNHIQADAVKARNIAVDEKIQIGGTRNNNNFGLILDGTATGDNDATIWVGDNVSSGGNAAFAVTRIGDVYSRRNLIVAGSATIGGNVNITGSGYVGANMRIDGTLNGADGIFEGSLAGGDISIPATNPKFEVEPNGRVLSRNASNAVMMDLNPSTGVFKFNGEVLAKSIVGDVVGARAKQVPTRTSNVDVPQNQWVDVCNVSTSNSREYERHILLDNVDMSTFEATLQATSTGNADIEWRLYGSESGEIFKRTDVVSWSGTPPLRTKSSVKLPNGRIPANAPAQTFTLQVRCTSRSLDAVFIAYDGDDFEPQDFITTIYQDTGELV